MKHVKILVLVENLIISVKDYWILHHEIFIFRITEFFIACIGEDYDLCFYIIVDLWGSYR